MLKGLEYVKETIEFRGNDIAGNEFETNNLLMDDVLVALGYNKRREQGVKAVYSGEADWEVSCNSENRFTIAVYGYGSDRPTIDQLSGAFNFAEAGEYTFVIVTDGKKLDIYNNGNIAVEIEDMFNDTADSMLNALSKQGWNPELILSQLKTNKLTKEDILLVLESGLDSTLIEDILNTLKVDINEENIDIVNCILSEVIKNSTLNEQLLNDKSILIDEVAKLTLELTNLGQQNSSSEEIEKLNNQIMNQLEEIKALKDKDSLTEKPLESNNTQHSDNESAYRDRISRLTEENQSLKTEVDNYKTTLADIEKKQANKEDERVTMARQLLDAVEDNKDLNRAYVGVVNAKLFQIGELNKFVGTCIQELYSTVSFELMHLLFDGDIFKIVQPAVRCDLLINAKSYDIDTSLLNEDEVISRLKSLFGKFEKVIFMCKTVGTIQTVEYEEYADNTTEYSFDDSQSDTTLDGQMEYEEAGDGSIITEDSISEVFEEEPETIIGEPIFDEPEIIIENNFGDTQFEEPDILNNIDTDVEYEEKIVEPKVLRLPLSNIGMVLWSEENPIIKPLAIGNSYKTFKLDSEDQFNSAVISIINLSDNILTSINTLENTELTNISANIHLGNKSESDTRILKSDYYTDTSDCRRYISVILTLAELLYIDSYDTYMYFEVMDNINYELESSCIAESSFDELARVNQEEAEECKDTIHCILSGSAVEKVVGIRGIVEAAEELIVKTIAVRTSYMTSSLKTPTDIAKAFESCLDKIQVEDLEAIINKVNTLTNNKIILTEEDQFSENSIEFIVGSNTYIVDKPTSSEVVMAMCVLHNSAMKDNAIDIRVELNSTLYTQYRTDLITSNCYEYFARGLLCGIMEGKTKIINK